MGVANPAAAAGVAVGVMVGEGVKDGTGVLLGCDVSVGKVRGVGAGICDLRDEQLETNTDIITNSMKIYCLPVRTNIFFIDT